MLVVFPSSTGLTMADSEEIRIWTEPLSRFAIVQWDQEYIIEALMLSRGFIGPRGLTKQLLLIWEQARVGYSIADDTAPNASGNPFKFAVLKSVIGVASAQLHESSLLTDEDPTSYQQILLRKALLKYFRVRIDSERLKALKRILDDNFATGDGDLAVYHEDIAAKTGVSPELLECITLAAQELHFVPRRVMLDSISSLATALTFRVGTALVGPSGVGKSTTYQILAKAFELCFQRRDQSGNPLPVKTK